MGRRPRPSTSTGAGKTVATKPFTTIDDLAEPRDRHTPDSAKIPFGKNATCGLGTAPPFLVALPRTARGRDPDRPARCARIRASGTPAYGSHRGCLTVTRGEDHGRSTRLGQPARGEPGDPPPGQGILSAAPLIGVQYTYLESGR